jgi:hypothetical protein
LIGQELQKAALQLCLLGVVLESSSSVNVRRDHLKLSKVIWFNLSRSFVTWASRPRVC